MLPSNKPSQRPIQTRRPPSPTPRGTKVAPRRARSWQFYALIAGFLAVGLSFAFVFGLAFLLLASPPRIADNVTIANVSIGGLTQDVAAATLRQNLPPQQLTLTDGARQWLISPADIGVTIDLEATLQTAETTLTNTSVRPTYQIDLGAAQNGFVRLLSQVDIAPQIGVPGRAVEIPVILNRLRSDVSAEVADGVFELNMIDLPPLAQPTIIAIVEPGQELALIARQYGVTVEDILTLNNITNPDLIYPGQSLVIPGTGVYVPSNPPPPPTNIGKAIVVSTGDQRIYAYENGVLVRTHLTSTGLPATPTLLGDYAVYVKYRATDMSGPDYFLPQVPFTMYFYQGYGIHGTYWHNSFGRPMSHGCVNLPTPEAEWFFNFAEVGTPVRVI